MAFLFTSYIRCRSSILFQRTMSSRVTSFKDTQPLKTLAKASKSCAGQSAAYGKCIAASYHDVSKDMCQAEFAAFKDCVQVGILITTYCMTTTLT